MRKINVNKLPSIKLLSIVFLEKRGDTNLTAKLLLVTLEIQGIQKYGNRIFRVKIF
jgi:hypothetical protein